MLCSRFAMACTFSSDIPASCCATDEVLRSIPSSGSVGELSNLFLFGTGLPPSFLSVHFNISPSFRSALILIACVSESSGHGGKAILASGNWADYRLLKTPTRGVAL